MNTIEKISKKIEKNCFSKERIYTKLVCLSSPTEWFRQLSRAHQMEPLFPLISWVNPFPSRFINRTILFCNALDSHECACWLLFDVNNTTVISLFSSILYQRTKPPQGTVLFINLLGVDSKGFYGRGRFHLMGSCFQLSYLWPEMIVIRYMLHFDKWHKKVRRCLNHLFQL